MWRNAWRRGIDESLAIAAVRAIIPAAGEVTGWPRSIQAGSRHGNSLPLDRLEFMSDATAIPILLDGDTGNGDFNDMRRLVPELEQVGVAGVCVEHKAFPKANSLIGGEQRALEDMQAFCEMIEAGKESRSATADRQIG